MGGLLEHRDAGPVCQDLSDLFLTDLSDVLEVAGAPLLFLLSALFTGSGKAWGLPENFALRAGLLWGL